MSRSEIFPAINIQWPISELILSGVKTIETRTYPLPEKYKNKKILIVETPGKSGEFKARIVGFIEFSDSFLYGSKKEFYLDKKSHGVDEKSPWAWQSSKPKYGWKIESVNALKTPIDAPTKRGIVFTTAIKVPSELKTRRP